MEPGVCPPMPGNITSDEKIRLLDSDRISAEDKLAIRRTFRNLIPESVGLRVCVDASAKKLFYEVDCTLVRSLPNSDCNCWTNSDLSKFCDCKPPTPVFTEDDIQFFANVILTALNKELAQRTKDFDPRVCKRDVPCYTILSVEIVESRSSVGTVLEFFSEYDSGPSDCVGFFADVGECMSRDEPIYFRHYEYILNAPSSAFLPPSEPYSAKYVGRSDEIGKWGCFYNMVEQVLLELESQKSRRTNRVSCCEDVCLLPKPSKDHFEDVTRYRGLDGPVFSRFCRNLMKWSSCTTKRWESITNNPHVVIHLPSMGYPSKLRCAARRQFMPLQNVQLGRLGWLGNENAQVIYVCPGKSDYETECTLRAFVKTARPDVELSNLWIIVNEEECLCCDTEEEYRSGSENLFHTPAVYRRVRYLSAGRRGFIIPGVLSKTDVYIACELRTSIIGPCLKFQERLLNKHYVMAFLRESHMPHAPYAGVRDFGDLCETMARMIIGLPWREGSTRSWLLKVNSGFCGKQSALVSLDCDECRATKGYLRRYLIKVLPLKIKVNKKAYKEPKDFFLELERYGGVLTVCPEGDWKTVSLGCFIQHDTAKACLRTAADVVQTCTECGYKDVGYIIPQTTLPLEDIQELVIDLGKALLEEQYVGYYGLDLVVFKDEYDDQKLQYWVVDIDPYYTDLLSFDDWRRFCLRIPASAKFYKDPKCAHLDNPRDHRYVVCSGKLYIEGLSEPRYDFFTNLCKKHNIAYSATAKTGCMICPIDKDRRAFLLFSFCRARKLAIGYFAHALRALHRASLNGRAKHSEIETCPNRLAQYIEESFGIVTPVAAVASEGRDSKR